VIIWHNAAQIIVANVAVARAFRPILYRYVSINMARVTRFFNESFVVALFELITQDLNSFNLILLRNRHIVAREAIHPLLNNSHFMLFMVKMLIRSDVVIRCAS
jgi:hypothetical protein